MSAPQYPNHLRAWREFRKLTQEQLADKAKCSKATIGHLENGERRLSDKWLSVLAPILQTRPGFILEHNPNDLPTDILDIWASIADADKPRAIEVLKAFRTGTGG
jgi:transcriptional regulator with XRE-family HTH domain